MGIGLGRVDGTQTLGVRAGQVYGDIRVFDRQGHFDLDGIIGLAIGIRIILAGVHPVRDALDFLADYPLGIGDQLGHCGLDRFQPIALGRGLHFLFRGFETADMGLKVTLDKMWGARIGQQNLEDFRFDLIVFKGFDGRNTESLFRDVCPPRLAARRSATKIHPVTPADRKAQQFRAFVKNRLNPGDVVNMRPAPVGIVHHIDVALPHVFDAELIAHGMGRKLHGRQMDGDVGGLAQQPHLRIINGIGEINHIGQNRRE